LREKNLHDHIE